MPGDTIPVLPFTTLKSADVPLKPIILPLCTQTTRWPAMMPVSSSSSSSIHHHNRARTGQTKFKVKVIPVQMPYVDSRLSWVHRSTRGQCSCPSRWHWATSGPTGTWMEYPTTSVAEVSSVNAVIIGAGSVNCCSTVDRLSTRLMVRGHLLAHSFSSSSSCCLINATSNKDR